MIDHTVQIVCGVTLLGGFLITFVSLLCYCAWDHLTGYQKGRDRKFRQKQFQARLTNRANHRKLVQSWVSHR